MPAVTNRNMEPIAGYTIIERIGAGGYGEVWRANAPGGLTKAVKFIYGYHDEERAERELKALNRIKEVRHPFLISLERIEVVDGQLVIVTELADSCLKDRFDACRDSGAAGIDRDELMVYMRDSADALDYMSEQHSLQHLDVKPENMLLVAGRIKVADFGLVKDIHDMTASLMGGLTPLYASPEVYEGRPSRRSDQYSLAIVFQEMLTGQLPFPGRTAAQLANQHLHARPRLNSLPEHDRSIIDKALSKSPDDRFNSCRELIDALQNAPNGSAVAVQASGGSTNVSNAKTEVGAVEELQESAGSSGDSVRRSSTSRKRNVAVTHLPEWQENAEVAGLPAIVPNSDSIALRPTLVVGVGDVGCRIASRLRDRMSDQFGGIQNTPAFDFILLDSDQRTLAHAGQSDTADPLNVSKLIHLPLRRSQSYRQGDTSKLQWISRRWLFNIPKSLRTEGLRPLGRLAFVDNADKVRDALRESMASCFARESITASSDHGGTEFESVPRVIVVGAISGGTAGGCMVDVGYMVRDLLDSFQSNEKEVLGIFTYSTCRNPAQNELSAVNGYSFLEELTHFHDSIDRFPGDRSCELPPSGDPPFDSTYVTHLGNELSEDEFRQQLEMVSDYLFLEVATNSAKYFREARKLDSQGGAADQIQPLNLRSFGTKRISCRNDDILAAATQQLCFSVTQRWFNGNGENEGFASRVDDVIASQKIGHEALIWATKLLLEKALNSDPDEFLGEQIEEVVEVYPNNPEAAADELQQRLEKLLGKENLDDHAPGEDPPRINERLRPLLRRFVGDKCSALNDWLVQWIDCPTDRVAGASELAKLLAGHFVATDEQLQEKIQMAQLELAGHQACLANLADPKLKKQRKQIARLLAAYAKSRLTVTLLEVEGKIVHALKGQVSKSKNTITDYGRDIKMLQRHFDSEIEEIDEDIFGNDDVEQVRDVIEELSKTIGTEIDGRGAELIEELDQRVNDELLSEVGLQAIFSQGGERRTQLPSRLFQIARESLVKSLADVNVAELICRDDGADPSTLISESMDETRPLLLQGGGSYRVVIVCPQDTPSRSQLVSAIEATGIEPTVVPVRNGDLVFCQEAEQISVTQSALAIIDGRLDLAQYAARVRTRTDIDWKQLKN